MKGLTQQIEIGRFLGRKPRAFTLMEMLVVISIMTLLLALLSPSLRRAQEKARAVQCKSNLRQVSIASTHYGDDTRYMPTGYHGPDVVWVAEIFEYTRRETKVFYCPSAPPQAFWAGVEFGSGQPAQFGYQQDQVRLKINENFSFGHNNGGSADGNKLGVGDTVSVGWNLADAVVMPADFIMYGDTTVDGLWDHFIDEDIEAPDGRNEYPADRHDGGAHIAFGDNHIELIEQKYLIITTPEGTINPEMRLRWNNDHQPH